MLERPSEGGSLTTLETPLEARCKEPVFVATLGRGLCLGSNGHISAKIMMMTLLVVCVSLSTNRHITKLSTSHLICKRYKNHTKDKTAVYGQH